MRRTPTWTISYHGDYETVEEHRRRLEAAGAVATPAPPPPSSPPALPGPVDICLGHFDAVAMIRKELFIFKDQVSDALDVTERSS